MFSWEREIMIANKDGKSDITEFLNGAVIKYFTKELDPKVLYPKRY